jgi:hypothetical protein
MRKSAAILGLACLFCGSAHGMWVKEGATAEDLKRDQSECERKASADTSFSQPRRGAGAGSGPRVANTMTRENQSFRLCMKSRGYVDPSDK